MSAEIIQFPLDALRLSRSLMEDYYAACRRDGLPVSSDKAKVGDPGIVLTTDGDLINVAAE